MKRFLVPLGLIVALAIPTAAQATSQPNNADFRNAKAQCEKERGNTLAERAAFR
jgi:hypothetical protein